jgi:transposase
MEHMAADLARPRQTLNRENATLEEIRVAMECTPCKKAFLRFQAIYYLHKNQDWQLAAELGLVSHRQLLRWVQAFNERGLDGLLSKPKPGRPRALARTTFIEKVLPVVRAPHTVAQTHWTAVKLHGWLKAEFQVQLSYSTVLRYLHAEDFRLKVPRPWPEGGDEVLRQEFCARLQVLAQDPGVELWFADEAGVEGDPRPRQRWAHKSDRLKIPYLGTHLRQSVLGAVQPASGQCCAIIFEHCDTEVFQLFLDTLAGAVPAQPGKKQYLILDNASWHKAKQLHWHHFLPLYLPPYSPDLNPIERLWLRLKADWFADFIARSREELVERLTQGLRHFLANHSITASLCSLKTSL